MKGGQRNPIRRASASVSFRLSKLVRTAAARAITEGRVVYCGDHTVLTRLENGKRIYVDMRDTTVAPLVALGIGWEPHVAQVLTRCAATAGNFFDVGANFGYHSLMIADTLRAHGGQMHLFEPNPAVGALLQRSLHVNALWDGVHLCSDALSDRPGHASLTVYEDLWGSARLQDPVELASSHHPWASTARVREQVTVPTITLDDYCNRLGIREIDLMKIDVEGHEVEVFAGMRETLARSPRLRVVMEFTFGAYRDPAEFWDFLSREFPHRFRIAESGRLVAVSSLDDLRAGATAELADIFLSRLPPTN